MNKIKTKINNAARLMLMGSILKSSRNYLPLTNREKEMVKWFYKFQIMIVLNIVLWTTPVLAIQSHLSDFKSLEAKVSVQEAIASPEPVLPQSGDAEKQSNLFKVLDEFTGTVYAYNSVEAQTDATPFWGAFGDITGMENKIVANNCYLKGTIVEIEGEKYEVYDRMNKRYGCDVFDIYMGTDIQAAKNFGKKITNVKILRKNQ